MRLFRSTIPSVSLYRKACERPDLKDALPTIAAYRAALDFKPDFALAYANLGVALRKQGRRAGAVAELHKARDLAPPGSELAGSIERELAEPFP
jgi:hypothetical protein